MSEFGATFKAFRLGSHGVAFCIQCVLSRSGEPTCNLELAPANSQSALWREKIVVQISPIERPEVLAVLLGYRTEMKAGYHGRAEGHNRGYLWSCRDQSLSLSIVDTGRQLSIALHPNEVFHITALLLNQMASEYPSLSGTDIAALVRRQYERHDC